MIRSSLKLVVLLAAAGCGQPDGPDGWVDLQRKWTEERGGVTGRVTDAATGKPLAGARVRSSGIYPSRTDSAGRYHLSDEGTYLTRDSLAAPPDSDALTVEVVLRGYVSERRHRPDRARIDTLNVALRRARPVRMKPSGRWRARFQPLDSAGGCAGTRAGARVLRHGSRRPVQGTIAFGSYLRPVNPEWFEYERSRYVWTVAGYLDVDLGALMSNRPGAIHPITPNFAVVGGWPWSRNWPVVAWVADGDSLEFALADNGSHFGMAFRGRLRGDSVVGRWTEYDSDDCYPTGRAVLWKER
jgi:hypothetical protein